MRIRPRKAHWGKARLRERLYNRRFLVPNAVTVGSMFCGFLTILYASTGRFEQGVIAIAIAILLDGLDGRVARRLNATSKFGGEFDSFADVISFGVAPAVLIYYWCLWPQADDIGVFFCFVFTLCAASRLARFNISAENLKGFVGMPTPAAAGMVAAVVHCDPVRQASTYVTIAGSSLMLILGYLMVSQIPFLSIKLITFRRVPAWAQIAIGALIALIWYNTALGFLFFATAYVASGPLMAVMPPAKATPERAVREGNRDRPRLPAVEPEAIEGEQEEASTPATVVDDTDPTSHH